jgi:mRNA interferase RelE/StbE
LAYKITFKKSVSKDLKKIDKPIAIEILDKINNELSQHATDYAVLKGKFAGLRKFRVGDYRIVFSIIETETVLVLRIAHRKEVYRK